MIGFKFWNGMDSIRKSIKKPIFKKKFSSYHGYFVINKNVFSFFLKAYNYQTMRPISLRKITIIQNTNSYNLAKFNSFCWLVFEKKKLKNENNNSFVCPTITGVKLT